MEPDPLETLAELSPRAREELLRVLTSPSNVRADVIRQFHERGSVWAEALMDLEEDEYARAAVVEALRSFGLSEDEAF